MNSGKYKIEAGRLVNIQTGIPIPDDEPVFILRAKDANAFDALSDYAIYCDNEAHILAVDECMNKFATWQKANPDKVKEPD
jgi:hypothetical protein